MMCQNTLLNSFVLTCLSSLDPDLKSGLKVTTELQLDRFILRISS